MLQMFYLYSQGNEVGAKTWSPHRLRPGFKSATILDSLNTLGILQYYSDKDS